MGHPEPSWNCSAACPLAGRPVGSLTSSTRGRPSLPDRPQGLGHLVVHRGLVVHAEGLDAKGLGKSNHVDAVQGHAGVFPVAVHCAAGPVECACDDTVGGVVCDDVQDGYAVVRG